MADNTSAGIAKRRLLVVEDDYLIALDLASWLENNGADVLGPAASVDDALMLLTTDSLPDAAVLDIRLGEEWVFPVADALQAARVPFLFLSGYDASEVPDFYRRAPCCPKPLHRPNLLRTLAEVLTAEN